jgi:hypothetical protein
MKIQVLREACCAQDDQLGPLEATYSVSDNATLGELVETIIESRFLQYSSSHTALLGEVRGVPVVKVFSPSHTGNRPAEFVASAGQSVASTVGGHSLQFRFVFGEVQHGA